AVHVEGDAKSHALRVPFLGSDSPVIEAAEIEVARRRAALERGAAKVRRIGRRLHRGEAFEASEGNGPAGPAARPAAVQPLAGDRLAPRFPAGTRARPEDRLRLALRTFLHRRAFLKTFVDRTTLSGVRFLIGAALTAICTEERNAAQCREQARVGWN